MHIPVSGAKWIRQWLESGFEEANRGRVVFGAPIAESSWTDSRLATCVRITDWAFTPTATVQPIW